MAVYCWGSTENGELGLGGIEDEQILVPRNMQWEEAARLKQAALGLNHTLFLLEDGQLFACGSNDHGNLGFEFSKKRPHIISALKDYPITAVAAGAKHSLAINEWGQVFSWGSNELSQLGYDTENDIVTPKIIRSLATKHVIQVSCGQFHSLALTNSGDLYAWGANGYGQLGLGMTSEKVSKPTLIKSLQGVPIAFICCGANHSFAVTKSGAVFGFGKNLFGQLGLNDTVSRQFPTQLKTLRSIGVCYIAAGDDFSVFLTRDGGVFTCGLGTFGQLGHGNFSNEILPRMVMELMGSTVTQIACGRRHTLVFVRGRIYAFGIGGSGQLGNKLTKNYSTPHIVIGPWSNVANASPPKLIENSSTAFVVVPDVFMVKHIFSGGDRSCVKAVEMNDVDEADDFRVHDARTQVCILTTELTKTLKALPIDTQVDLELLSTIEIIFRNQACLNGSFLLANDKHFCCTSKMPGVDMAVATEAFEDIQKTENESVKNLIWESITTDLIGSLVASPPDVETIRIFLLLPLYHEFINCKNYQKLHVPFSTAVHRLNAIPKKIVSAWWCAQSRDYYERLVENYKSVVTYILNNQFMKKPNKTSEDKYLVQYDPELKIALDMLALLYLTNHKSYNRTEKVPYEHFHLQDLSDNVDVKHEYVNWIMNNDIHNFYLCNYPFLFDAAAKTILLQTDQSIQMYNAMQSAANQGLLSMFTRSFAPTSALQYIVLNVTRENIVDDTIRELALYQATDLKKPLKIKFAGEEAEDAGGVRKEFFMLLLKEILDLKYGMFKYYEDSRYIWFSEDSFEGEGMYTLIGILCGLAIYNYTIIDLPFPVALYKKLLKEPVELSDLKDLSPVLGNSLQSILDYEESDLKDVFSLTFEVSREVFGETKTFELKPGGDSIYVTQENKREFVDLYVDFILNKSVESHFKGFYQGFMKVCGGRILELFRAHELMEVVIGNEDYDWHVLEREAEYKNGYSSGDEPVRWFWEVFHELPLEEKKKFLLFLTGSDRIPIMGMKAIKIFIQPTNDDKCLPVAHTCFNLLDLPRYKTKERLKYKLQQAIQQTQGFSLV
ncbi:probable E3 ubiquitin-protein ligase HERC4 isoform X2 [Culicoides brevitarsis]|uniref:probable E3 ubiquitin-protein ligase HERC4 isoform X2 n=1 Tax=Culicoides brevitarsis TaxID=469753 RepID=UPI00307BF0D4